MKGKHKGTQYTDKEVGKMVKSTSKVPGSVLRRTTGPDKVLKLQGRKVTKANRAQVKAAGAAGFTALPKLKSVLRKVGGASGGRKK
jgi:hypothetical protein